jgi:serine/threonine-protein kinase ATR
MTTLKLAMQQCSQLSELNCKLWDTFLRNIDKSALGAILNQVSVNLLQLIEMQPFKISKIFEYLIIQNKDYLQNYFNELYFLPLEHSCLTNVNEVLRKYTDINYLIEHTYLRNSNISVNPTINGSLSVSNSNSVKVLIYLTRQYLKGAMHENADLRVKALEKLHSLLKERSSELIFLIERQDNTTMISEIMQALLNGCRDSDHRVKLLCGLCLGEIGAVDPANCMILTNTNNFINNITSVTKDPTQNNRAHNSLNISNTNMPCLSVIKNNHQSNDLLMNSSLVNDDSNEFSDNFSCSLIIELSKAYLAARNTHEQDSASYAIQECLKIYGCSLTSSNQKKIENSKLWNSFPDYFKEILVPLQTSKYEIKSFDNLGSLKTPIILSECKSYEEWIYKWCAYLISKIDTHFSKTVLESQTSATSCSHTDRELKVFPKLQFINRFNVNVSLFILPYVIIKMIIYSKSEIIEQIYEEMMSVIQLNQLVSQSVSTANSTSSSLNSFLTNNNGNINNIISSSKAFNHPNSSSIPKTTLHCHHICCQTIFNIYDHLVRQLNFYRAKMNELQGALKIKNSNNNNNTRSHITTINNNRNTTNSTSEKQSTNELMFFKYKDLFELLNKFIKSIPHKALSKAAFECKAYTRSLLHAELHMRNTAGSFQIQGSVINIKQEHLIELQNLYASMDEIDAASGILLLKNGSEESLADAAFRHKINGRVNESIACIEQILESNAHIRSDLKQHETYIKTFISIGRHRNALNYLESLMNDKPEWKEMLDSYRIEACWKLGSWDKLKQILKTSVHKTKVEDSFLTNENLKSIYAFNNLSDLPNFQSQLKLKSLNTFNANIGKLFALVAEKNEKKFYETLIELREQQIGPLSAASMESGGNSYQRGYEYVVNLQALQEIENCLTEMLRLRNDSKVEKDQYRNALMKNLDSLVIDPWERRVLVMQPSFRHLEPIYNVRIALLNFISSHLEIDLKKHLAKLWLRLAKIARKAGMFENSYQYMLNAQGQIKPSDSSNLEELLVEKAKWYWQREDKDSALFYLQKGLNELFDLNTIKNDSNIANNDLYSKVLLMYTKFSEENGSLDSETIRKNYLDVQKMRKNSEQVHFELAQFTDRLATSVSENVGKKEKFWEYLPDIVNYYSMSLEFGTQFIYQSLPRMMSLWLDFGADYFEIASRENRQTVQVSSNAPNVNKNLSSLNNILVRINQILSNALQRIPTYSFLTVYPQLVSRICHPEERVFEHLSSIIMKVLFLYPHQAIWMLIAVKNSSVELRKNRCKVIMDKAIRQQPDLKKFICDSSELAEKLVQLGNFNVDMGVTQLCLSNSFKPLKRLVESKDFSRILIPSQFQITLQLPTSNSSSSVLNNNNLNSLQNFRSHNPYPLELIYINGFEENVLVMNSLQKPKRISIRGTDGKIYSFLCKAKDDLRIDYRIMEFFSVVNKCLKQEPESRRRNLYIRTYAVTPLNENSGIIEWIENLATLRSILIKLYQEKGVGPVTSSEWKQHEEKIIKDKEYAIKVFRIFLDRYKPTVLCELSKLIETINVYLLYFILSNKMIGF